jgi:hypothetical protein
MSSCDKVEAQFLKVTFHFSLMFCIAQYTNFGSVAKKDHMRVKYLPWIVIGGSRDGFQVETYRANDYNNGSPLVSSLLIKL